MTLTPQQLRIILPRNKNIDALCVTLNNILPKYEINTIQRVAAFLAQCGHESADFSILSENLNYSAATLMKLFPSRFPNMASTSGYVGYPDKIANKIYGDRMGNGKEITGDGYRYRGRGAIQLTGKENYSNFAKSINKTLDDTIAYCETLDGAIESACWFWTKNKLNRFADTSDMVGLTKAINGGLIGLEERKKHYSTALATLKS